MPAELLERIAPSFSSSGYQGNFPHYEFRTNPYGRGGRGRRCARGGSRPTPTRTRISRPAWRCSQACGSGTRSSASARVHQRRAARRRHEAGRAVRAVGQKTLRAKFAQPRAGVSRPRSARSEGSVTIERPHALRSTAATMAGDPTAVRSAARGALHRRRSTSLRPAPSELARASAVDGRRLSSAVAGLSCHRQRLFVARSPAISTGVARSSFDLEAGSTVPLFAARTSSSRAGEGGRSRRRDAAKKSLEDDVLRAARRTRRERRADAAAAARQPHRATSDSLSVRLAAASRVRRRRRLLVFLLDELGDRHDLVVAFDVDQPHALGRAADGADVVGLHPEDHALLRDEQQLVALLHVGDADDLAVAVATSRC